MAHDTARSSATPADHLQAYGGIIIVVALSIIVGGLFGSIALALVSGFVPADSPIADAFSTAAQFVGFGAVGLGYLAARDEWDLIRLEHPTRRDMLWVGGGVLALFAVYLAGSAVMSALGIESGDSVLAQQGEANPVYFLYLTIITIVLVGPAEELIFRGIAYGELRRLWGPIPAIIGSSAVFASIHVWSFSGDGAIISLLMVFILGSVLAAIYERSGNLVVVAVAHGLFNAVQFVASYLSVTGLI